MVLETSLKAIHHLVGDSPPPQSHRLAVLIDSLSDTLEAEKAAQAISALRVDRLPPSAYDEHDLREVFTNWRVHGTYDAAGIASDYLPTERLEVYFDAADQITDLLIDSLRSRTPGGRADGHAGRQSILGICEKDETTAPRPRLGHRASAVSSLHPGLL